MKRNFLVFTSFVMVVAVLLVLPGSGQSTTVYLDDLDPNLRAAASSVLSTLWANMESSSSQVSSGTLFGTWDKSTSEARATGFLAQRARIVIGGGDPQLGPFNAKAYAAAAAAGSAQNPVKAYVRASAAFFAVRDGFAIVPGGPAEAFNRLQTCLLNGAIETNQGNAVAGVAFDCSKAPITLALADTIASGWYVSFGHLVNFGCDEMVAQASEGKTVAARWAAANAWLKASCGSPADVANADSAELRAASVVVLAQELAAGGDAAALLATAADPTAGSFEFRRAHALAAGLIVEATEPVTISSLGSPSTATLGSLLQNSLGAALTPLGDAYIAPLARYLDGGDGALNLSVFNYVKGSALPLISYITTL